jgi:hypothetical protein
VQVAIQILLLAPASVFVSHCEEFRHVGFVHTHPLKASLEGRCQPMRDHKASSPKEIKAAFSASGVPRKARRMKANRLSSAFIRHP